jgi:hypothetical protein
MPSTSHYDALQHLPLELQYNRITSPLDDTKAIIAGENTYITLGGILSKRPGLTDLGASTAISLRCDRLWAYETMEATPKVYILGSFYDSVADRWKMYYWRPGASGWTAMPDVRDVNASTRPHEVVISRGLAFIKGFPHSSSSEKLGTVVFDGAATPTPTLTYWGILGPDQPMVIDAVMTKLAADIDASATSLTVTDSTGFPTPPFIVLIDYELINVTAVSGTTWTVSRGYLSTPTNAHKKNALIYYRPWNPSDHNVTVNSSWKYTYVLKMANGHVSNRAPLEENPDKPPSETRFFFDQIPKLLIPVPSDTTNVPEITVYRTTDGGGSFYYLETVTNGGTSPQAYYDDSLESGTSGGTFNDPIPDTMLNTLRRAPTLTSNSPPPTVLLPKVLGVDTPEPSTRIVSYATRLWYAIGNVLFFSAQEELDEGVPEHAWPSGSFGNFFKLTEPITNLEATTNALWVFTPTTVYSLTGTNLETFSLRPRFKNIGAIAGHPQSVTSFRDRVAFMTQDFRVAVFSEDSEPLVISLPLGDSLQTQIQSGATVQIQYYPDMEREYLIVSCHRPTAPSASTHFVFDLGRGLAPNKQFWFTPWTIQSTASVISRTVETPQAPRLVFAVYDGTATRLAYLDATKATDVNPATGAPVGFSYYFQTSLFPVPGGNHVNLLRRPAMMPKVQRILVENSGVTPVVTYYRDSLTTASSGTLESPEYLTVSGYAWWTLPVDEVAYRIGVRIASQASDATQPASYYAITIIWYPEAGV